MSLKAASKYILLALILFATTIGFAQQGAPVSNGPKVSGTVVDPDGAEIPGANIIVTGAGGRSQTTTSKSDGTYSVSVPAGTYSVTVTMPGFASYSKSGVRVPAAGLVQDIKMALASEDTTINVTTTSAAVSVDPDSNSSAVVLKGADLDALSDDPDELSAELTALAGPAAGPNGGQIYIDGFTGGQLPPKSSIREIRINQNPFSAQYDKPGFGRIEILTKPGADRYHGNLNIQGNFKQLNTSNPFTQNQPMYHTLFMVGSVGGPVTKTSSFTVNGSYRDIEDNNLISGVQLPTTTGDPTGLCAAGNATCPIANYNAAINHPQKRYDIGPRFDFALGEKNTVTIRYQYQGSNIQNNSVGGFSLPSVATNQTGSENTLQISDTQIFSSKVINETRFEWQRTNSTITPFSTAPSINVQQQFSAGGNSSGFSGSTDNHFEFQNYTSIALAKHFLRLGGRVRSDSESATSYQNQNGVFVYNSVSNYKQNLLSQYSKSIIVHPTVSLSLTDVGLYAEDDWKIRPNLTWSFGTRYEAQNQINSHHDFAPRTSIAWGVPRKGKPAVTVVRAGSGIFYDRFQITNVLTTLENNGVNSIDYTVRYATPITTGCTPSNPNACTTNANSQTTYAALNSTLSPVRSAYLWQTAIGVDQQINRAAKISVNYINSRGEHQFMTRAYTNGTNNPITYAFDAGGVYRENQLQISGNYQLGKISFFGYYALTYAKGNTSGAGFIPTVSTSTTADYGRTNFDIRNQGVIAGSATLKWGILVAPFLQAKSGSPFNITTGQDQNQDGIINDRPAFSGTKGSCFDRDIYTIPAIGSSYTPVPINYCTGPAGFSFNARIAKTFGFGPKVGARAQGNGGGDGGGRGPGGPGGGGPGGGGGRGGPGGGFGGMRGAGGRGGGTNTGRRFNLTFAVQGFNIFNYVDYSTPNGALSSANFGKSTQLIGQPITSNTAVRRITLQTNFTF